MQLVKNPSASSGDTREVSSIPGSGRSPGIGNGNPLQYSCLENSMDRGAWRAIVHGVSKRQPPHWARTHEEPAKWIYQDLLVIEIGFLLPGAGGMTAVGYEGTFWGDGNVLYFYGGDGYMALYICQRSSLIHIKCVHFTICKLYHKTLIKK